MPDGWRTFDSVAFLVEGERPPDSFSIWFLPADWVGIRLGASPAPNYWEGVLSNSEYKTITVSTERTIPPLLRSFATIIYTEGGGRWTDRMSTASLVNSGWTKVAEAFGGRFSEAEAAAHRLVEKHCKDEASRDAAAYSLIVLGVPAKNIFLKRAVRGKGRAREFCISVLRYFGGRDSVETLCGILQDVGCPDPYRKSAATGLGRIGDSTAGPVLVAALRRVKRGETLTSVVRAIGEIGFSDAGPELVEIMAEERNRYALTDIARTLERIQ